MINFFKSLCMYLKGVNNVLGALSKVLGHNWRVLWSSSEKFVIQPLKT